MFFGQKIWRTCWGFGEDDPDDRGPLVIGLWEKAKGLDGLLLVGLGLLRPFYQAVSVSSGLPAHVNFLEL